MTTIYTGLDIAKLNLQLHFAGRVHDLPNTAAGHRQLIKLLAAQPGRPGRLRSHWRLRTRRGRGTA